MPKIKQPWEVNIERREAALKTFKSSFKKEHPVFATAVKKLCNTPERDDEPHVQKVASLLLDNKDMLTQGVAYLAAMTSECNLGRSKVYPAALMGEGENKLRTVMAIVFAGAV